MRLLSFARQPACSMGLPFVNARYGALLASRTLFGMRQARIAREAVARVMPRKATRARPNAPTTAPRRFSAGATLATQDAPPARSLRTFVTTAADIAQTRACKPF